MVASNIVSISVVVAVYVATNASLSSKEFLFASSKLADP